MSEKFAEIRDGNGNVLVEMIGPGADTDLLSIGLRALTFALQQREQDKDHAGGFFGGSFGYGVEFENAVFYMKPYYTDEACSCGRSEEAEAWHAAHAHSQDCYDTELHDGRLRSSDLDAAHEAALTRRGLSKSKEEYRAAQRDVTATYEAQNALSDRVRRELCEKHGIEWNDGRASMCHCTCGHDAECDQWFDSHPHAERCSVEMPNFWHKPSGVRVRWYKYIGRDNEVSGECRDGLALFEECLRSIEAPSLRECLVEMDRLEAERSAHMKEAMPAMMSAFKALHEAQTPCWSCSAKGLFGAGGGAYESGPYGTVARTLHNADGSCKNCNHVNTEEQAAELQQRQCDNDEHMRLAWSADDDE